MEARLKSGKIVKGRIAQILINKGRAVEVDPAKKPVKKAPAKRAKKPVKKAPAKRAKKPVKKAK